MEELILQQTAVLEQIAFDLRVILLFTVLAFVAGCFRSWRKNMLGGNK